VAVKAALTRIKITKALVSVVFVNASEIKKWNRKYRNKNRPTDILSFGWSKALAEESKWKRKGELLICEKEATKGAREKSISLAKEIKLLLVHGSLHLSGFDHEKEKDAKAMFALQKKILDQIK
jgi:probable rRNA maturation factor